MPVWEANVDVTFCPLETAIVRVLSVRSDVQKKVSNS